MPPKGWGDAELMVNQKQAEKAMLKATRELEMQADKVLTDARVVEVKESLVRAGFPDLLADELLERLSATKLKWAFCPDCRRKVQVDAVDAGQQMKALEMALGYVIGKPKERKELDITVGQKPLEQMTLAEKQAYLLELRTKELGA